MLTLEEEERVGREIESIKRELDRATSRFYTFNSPHEGYAVIKEELDELWDEVKRNDTARAREEAIQVAAMAIRFLLDIYEGE